MDFSVKGAGAGARYLRHNLPERRRQSASALTRQHAGLEEATVFPAELGCAEQMRAAIVSVNQAIEAGEIALAWAATAAAGLQDALAHARRIEDTAVQTIAAAGGTPEAADWRRLQERWQRHCRVIDAVGEKTRFGPARLLDGTLGCRAAAFGPGLELAAVGDLVRSSPPEGYEVVIAQEPTRATLLGTVPLTMEVIASGLELALEADGRRAHSITTAGQTPDEVAEALNGRARSEGVPVTARLGPGGRLLVQHLRYGSRHAFRAWSSRPGILSQEDGSPSVVNGRDVAGALHGEPADGKGLILTGHPQNRFTAGLAVRYRPVARPGDGWKDGRLVAGRVLVAQQRLRLRWEGPEGLSIALRLDPVLCKALGRVEDGDGALVCLADVTNLPPERAGVAMRAARKACAELNAMLEQTREAAEMFLPRHMARLRVQAQNLAAASQAITAPDLAVDAVTALAGGLRRRDEGAAAMPHIVGARTLLKLLETNPATDGVPKLN